MFQNQCANLQTFFENAGFLSIFYDISCGFVVLFNDPYALIFVVLAAIVGIVFGALPGLTAAAAIAMVWCCASTLEWCQFCSIQSLFDL